MIVNKLMRMATACIVLCLMPWLIALGLSLGNYLVNALATNGKPAFHVPVPTAEVWTATKWLSIWAAVVFNTYVIMLLAVRSRHPDANENPELVENNSRAADNP